MTEAGAVRAVLFDFTGIVTSSPFTALEAVARDIGWDTQRLRELVTGRDEDNDDHPFQRMLRGESTLAEYYLALMDRLDDAGVTIDISELIRGFTALKVNKGIPERIAALRSAGVGTALVTNTVREAAGLWSALVDLDAVFDVVVASYEVGIRKPDVRIWQLALERLGGIEPGAAVLLDGTAAFWPAARAMGLQVIEFDDPYEGFAQLDRLLAGN